MPFFFIWGGQKGKQTFIIQRNVHDDHKQITWTYLFISLVFSSVDFL